MVLMPLLCGLLLYCFLLIVWANYEDWIDCVPWPEAWIEWGESIQKLFHEYWNELGRIQFRLPELQRYWVRKVPEKGAPAAPASAPLEPPQKPPQVSFLPLGPTHGMRKPGFIWSKKDEIE